MTFVDLFQFKLPNPDYIYLTSPVARYATASARSDGLLLLCGGRDANSVVSVATKMFASCFHHTLIITWPFLKKELYLFLFWS